jgi:hypothetical protein
MIAFRRTGTTSAASLCGLVVALGLTHASAPEWSRRAGLDFWNLTHEQECLWEIKEESARLSEESERLRESIEATDHLATRILVGELTLTEATDLLEPLLKERSSFRWSAATLYPAPSFRLSIARYLIERVQRAGQGDSGRWAAAIAQLRAEYQSMQVTIR